ncbi:hypothetical protein MKX03_021451 [Papaver bracteatum]|nr:hypothetical protein MKX03_021451 [Papaver bracteatum]
MSRLIRNAYKSVASGLKYHTMNQRLLKSADKYESHYGELSKVSVDYLDLNCPKKMKEVLQVLEVGKELGTTVDKLFHDIKHFKLHEEPNLTAVNMLRGYVFPSAVAATLGILVAEIAYSKQLKEECLEIERELSALERKLSAESAK